MSRVLLLADSNFVNNIGEFSGRKIKNLEVKSCQSRKAVMSGLAEVEEGIVIVSCLDTIAANIVKTTPEGAENAVEVYYNQLIYKLIDRADEADGKLAYGVMAPLFWNSIPEEVRRVMNHVYKLLKKTPIKNVLISDPFKNVWARADGTHVTRISSQYYIRQIQDFMVKVEEASAIKCLEFEPLPEVADGGVDWAEDGANVVAMDEEAVSILSAPGEEVVSPARTTTMMSESILLPPRLVLSTDETQRRLLNLANPLPDMTVPPPSAGAAAAQLPDNGAISLFGLSRRLGVLESKVFYNNLMTASLKEELDTEANKAMLNKVTVAGVVIPGIENLKDTDKIAAMKAKVAELIELLKEEDQEYEVQFVRHLNNQVRGQKSSVLEVRFASPKQAMAFRAEFAKKQKTVTLPDKVNITPVVRLATRVRIEMMHSIANAIKRYDTSVVRALCLQYIPKPVIKVVRKSAMGQEFSRTMSFIEAVSWVKENHLQQSIDFNKARERAGVSQRSTLAQHFVLLD